MKGFKESQYGGRFRCELHDRTASELGVWAVWQEIYDPIEDI